MSNITVLERIESLPTRPAKLQKRNANLPDLAPYLIPLDTNQITSITGAAKNIMADVTVVDSVNDTTLKTALDRSKVFMFNVSVVSTVLNRAEAFSNLSPSHVILPLPVVNTLMYLGDHGYTSEIEVTANHTINNIKSLVAKLKEQRKHIANEYQLMNSLIRNDISQARHAQKHSLTFTSNIDLTSFKEPPFVLITQTLLNDTIDNLNRCRQLQPSVESVLEKSIKSNTTNTTKSNPIQLLNDTKKQATIHIANTKIRAEMQKEFAKLKYLMMTLNGNFCSCCGKQPGDIHDSGKHAIMTGDHIKPFVSNPELRLNLLNIQILCDECNSIKGSDNTTDWRTTQQKDNLIKHLFDYVPMNNIERDLIIKHYTFNETQKSIAELHMVSPSMVQRTYKKIKPLLLKS